MTYTKYITVLPIIALVLACASPCAALAATPDQALQNGDSPKAADTPGTADPKDKVEPINSVSAGDSEKNGKDLENKGSGTSGTEKELDESGAAPDDVCEATGTDAVGSGDEKPYATAVVQREAAGATRQADSEPALRAASETPPDASIHYRTHVQNIGWEQKWKADGELAGTTGRSLRLEAFEFYLTGASGGVHCMVHVQNIGWQQMSNAMNGEHATSGTTGQSLRLEGIMLTLSGEVSRWYDIEYRVHVQNDGWQDWVRNGAMAGTSGRSLRLEGINVRLVAKNENEAPAEASDGCPGVTSSAHVQNDGWHAQQLTDTVVGTTGQSKRIEAIRLWVDSGKYGGGIKYRAHCQNVGWTDWSTNGQVGGTTGKGLRMEALEIALTGEIASHYDVIYRAHVQNVGWQPWTVTGGTAGTTGQSLRMEAIQIKLVKKGAYDLATDAYAIRSATAFDLAAEDPAGSTSAGTQMQAGTRAGNAAQTFYLRNEGSGRYSIQSVASGLFLADQGGKFVQSSDVDDAGHRWTLSWDAGVVLTNAQTGKVLAMAGGAKAGAKLVTANRANAANQRWMIEQVPLIADGYYEVRSRVGTTAAISSASFANGVDVRAAARNGAVTQSFYVYRNGAGYVIENSKSHAPLTVSGKSKADGANVLQSQWAGDNSQRWAAQLDREGFITFRNVGSGLMLEVADSSPANDANICQGAADGSTGQQWKLVGTTSRWLSGNATLDRNVANVLRTHSTLRSVYDWAASQKFVNGEIFPDGPFVLPDSKTIELANAFFEKGGNCYQYGSAFTWLARGLGYTCNTMAGHVVNNRGSRSAHGWAEVKLNGTSYICDPDMQVFYPTYNWYMQTYDSAPAYYSR